MKPDFLYEAQGGKCFHCDLDMNCQVAHKDENGKFNNGWTREHIVPISKGGRGGKNVVLAHAKCNSAWGRNEPSDEMRQRAARIWMAGRRLSKKLMNP